MPNRIAGYATPEGTERFQARFEGEGAVAPGHFRRDFQQLYLSSVGMGSYLGEPDEDTNQQVEKATQLSVQSGAINVLDTAINYRFQFAERSIGLALKALIEQGVCKRDEVFVSSKNGYLTPDAGVSEDFTSYFRREYLDSGVVNPNDIVRGMHCMSTTYLDNQLERSLDNLGLETIDLMYLHNAAESQLPEIGHNGFFERLRGAFEFYEAQRKANRIRYYGLATWDCFRVRPDHPSYLSLEEVVKLARQVGGDAHGFCYIQFPYNIVFREALILENQQVDGQTMTLLQAAEALGIGVFTSVPLLQGQLLDQPLPQFPGLSSPAQKCIQFARSTSGVLAPLVGQKDPLHIQDNLQVAQVSPLTDAQFKEFVHLQRV